MKVQRAGRSFTLDVTADGEGLVSHAGATLLGEVADRVGLTRELSAGLAGVRSVVVGMTRAGLIRDLAVMLADGGDCLLIFGRFGIRSRCLVRSRLTRRRSA